MAKLISTNPANNEKLGEVEVSTPHDVEVAVKNARSAQSAWAQLTIEERIRYFVTLLKVIRGYSNELAQTISNEMGKPISDARDEVDEVVSSIQWMIDNAQAILGADTIREDVASIIERYHEPYGVSAAIAAWNFPLSNFKECVLQDLLSGNAVVLKHSEENPLVGKLIDKMMSEAEFPDGVFGQVYGGGEVGGLLTDQNVDFISFIGSSKVGRELYKKAAEKFINVRLEMGGSSPGIVFEDVDVEKTAIQVVSDRFFNSGQVCDALKRLIVHDSIYDEFIEEVKKQIQALKFGDPKDESTTVSSLVAERQVKPILDQIDSSVEAGARVLLGGKRADDLKGAFIEPTLIVDVDPSMPVWSEEVFGPVLPIMKFSSEKEAIDLANNSPYGLSAYVHTGDKQRATRVARDIKAGQVATNGVHNYYPEVCFGGYKGSGIGRTSGAEGLLGATQVKIITSLK